MITERPSIVFSLPTPKTSSITQVLSKHDSVQVGETSPSSFSQVLKTIGHETHRGEALMRQVIHGGGSSEISSTEMLALQAGVYRYVELVDLTSKLVDRATQGVKTVMQSSGGG